MDIPNYRETSVLFAESNDPIQHPYLYTLSNGDTINMIDLGFSDSIVLNKQKTCFNLTSESVLAYNAFTSELFVGKGNYIYKLSIADLFNPANKPLYFLPGPNYNPQAQTEVKPFITLGLVTNGELQSLDWFVRGLVSFKNNVYMLLISADADNFQVEDINRTKIFNGIGTPHDLAIDQTNETIYATTSITKWTENNRVVDSGFWTYNTGRATFTSTKDLPRRIAANDGIVYYTTNDGFLKVYENGQSKVNVLYPQQDIYHDIAWVSTPQMRKYYGSSHPFTPSQLWISVNDTYSKMYPQVTCPVAAAGLNSCSGFGTCDMMTGICNTCTCETGWAGAICQTPTCASPCQNGGTCSGHNTCTCAAGWAGAVCQTPTCTPKCENSGQCTGPNTCTCAAGWAGEQCLTPTCASPCQNGGGICSGPNTCTCSNPLLEYPGCIECKDNKLLAPPDCVTCLYPNRVAPECTECMSGTFLNPDNMCEMCGDNHCSKPGCGCAQGICAGDDRCTCITAAPPRSREQRFDLSISMRPNATAYTYAPIEMFETNAPTGEYGYYCYIYGFWGFIQTSGNQVFAEEYVKYNPTYNNPQVDKKCNWSAGSELNTPGYVNAGYYRRAKFNQPEGLAVCKTKKDNKYNRPIIFVADTGNHCIRMISATISNVNGPNGNPSAVTRGVSTLTGSNWDGIWNETALSVNSGFVDGTLNEALFNGPTGLDFDSNGVLYVADTGNNAIRKVVIDQAAINIANIQTAYPQITGRVDTLEVPHPQLDAPRGVLFNNGFLYVCDNTTIRKIDLDTQTWEVIATNLNQPYGMVFSGSNLLFSDATGVKILVSPGDIRPAPNAMFSAGNRPQPMIEYIRNPDDKNENVIVVGLKGATAVQIAGNKCTCFLDVSGNC